MERNSKKDFPIWAWFFRLGKSILGDMENYKLIKTLRKQQKLSQERLGELIGRSHTVIAKLENGVMKPIALLLLLAGCAFSQAVDKERASREDLLSCLQQNEQEPQKCSAQALIYQTDKADLDRRMVNCH